MWQLQLTCLAESTQKAPETILPIPISRTKLFNWKILHPASLDCYANPCNMGGSFIVCGLYDAVFTLEGYGLLVAMMAPQVFVWQYPDVFNSFSFCVCCYENKRICRPDDWLCRDCHGKCHTFESRMGSVVSVDSHLFSWCRVTFKLPAILTAVCICCSYQQQLVFL